MFARSTSTWTTAFTTATKVEAEGAKYFEGFLPTTRKSTNPTISTDTSTNDKDLDVDEEDVGGFCQPQHLALFVQRVNSSNPTSSLVEDAENTIDTEHGRVIDTVEKNNMGRQICRAWLKHHFLSLGNPCAQKNCERRHDVDGMNVGQLYKDFSFKGLATAQRNTIIKSVQVSQGEDISTANSSSSSGNNKSGSSSSSSSGSSSSTGSTTTRTLATGLKRKQGDDNDTMGIQATDSLKVARIDDIPTTRTALQSKNTTVAGPTNIVIKQQQQTQQPPQQQQQQAAATTTAARPGKRDRIFSAQVIVDPLYPRYTLEGERKRKNVLWLPWDRSRW